MLNLIELTKILRDTLTVVELRQFSVLIPAFFCSSHATTTRSLARYADCSERTIFRFLKGEYNWAEIRCRLFSACSFDSMSEYILAIDETVEGKSRRKTFGLARFYSSIAQQTISSVCFFGASLVNVKTETAYFLGAEQVVYNEVDKARTYAAKAKKAAGKDRAKKGETKSKGRKLGTKNKPKEENLTASFRTLKVLITKVLLPLRKWCKQINIHYVVANSAYGTKDYADLASEMGLYLLSKFKCNVALYLPYTGEQKGGKPRVYGEKLDVQNIPITFLREDTTTYTHRFQYYQLVAYAQNTFRAQHLNIVIIRVTNLKNNKISTQIWFCTDLKLNYMTLLHYYHLRFQIEFDFRDAKQYFGFADFKNYKQQNLTNFVNLSFTMCLIAKIYQAYYRKILNKPKLSTLDLKTIFKARFTAKNLLKLVQNDTNSIFNDAFCNNFIPNDLINAA
jgi:putative transposase